MQFTKNLIQFYYKTLIHYATIFIMFLYRDFVVSVTQSYDFLINSLVIEPFIFIVGFGYLVPALFFKDLSHEGAQTLFIGNMLLLMIKYTFDGAIRYATDLEQRGFIIYQTTLVPAWLVLIEHICFQALLTTLILMPFLPLARLFLWSAYPTNVNWFALLLMLFLGSLLCSAYHFCAFSYIRRYHAGSFWARVTTPLMLLGGQWIYYALFASYSTALGIFVLFNPFLYITEGIRQAYIGGPLFFALWKCVMALLLFIGILVYGAIQLLKKRIDYV